LPVSASAVIEKPTSHTACDGVSRRGSIAASAWGRSPCRAIAYTMRDTPRIDVSNTLAVAIIAPAESA
jgi:hypothetical protein